MNILGPDIYAALLSVRRFHEHVALLLRTADAHMLENGFKKKCGNTTLAEGSGSLDQPIKWMPNTAFRFYSWKKDAANIVVFASVIMCPRGPESHARPWKEPLVTAGWLRLAKPVSKWNQYNWASMITWTDVERDGTLSQWISSDGKPCKDGSLERRCLAVPLVEITSTEGLTRRVLAPVIESLGTR